MTIRGWLFLSLALGVSAPLAAQATPFQAITLTEAIALAQQRGHQARAARAAREAARYRHRAFRSGLLPQLSLDATVPSYERSITGVPQPDGSTEFLSLRRTNGWIGATLTQKVPLTGGDLFVSSSLAGFSTRETGQPLDERWFSTPVSVGLSQPLFRPNTVAWDRREEVVETELDERAYLEAMEDVALQTSNAFFDAYAARVGLDNATKNAAVNDTLYRLNTGRFEVGRIGENDLLQSELVLLRSRTALESALLAFERANDALRLALGLPPGTRVEVTVTGDVPAFEADTARAVAEALRNRAAVSRVALDDVQARRRVTEARYPSGTGATVQASYGLNATALDASRAYQDLGEASRFTLSVQLPLWLWGARAEDVRAAKADRDRVASLSQATIEQLAHEARFAALELAQARRTVALSGKADSVATKRFEVAYNRYVIGRIAIDNLYLAQQEKDQALVQYVQALRGYWAAYYRLRRATLFDFAMGQAIRQ
jgi:outer membrane protein TolC